MVAVGDMQISTDTLHLLEAECPNCGHLMNKHELEVGCTQGWTYYGPDSIYAGLGKSEGCPCPLTLAGQHNPPHEGEAV